MRFVEIGDILVAVGVLTSGLAAVLSLPFIRRFVPGEGRVPRALASVSFASLTAAFLMLVWASLSSDFTYSYVWEQSSSDLGAVYKLSSVWAGGAGSLLLCTWLVSAVLVAEIFVRGPALGASGKFERAFASMMSLLITFFAYATLMTGPFDRTDPALLEAYPDGRGLDIMLQTPEMVLHAPLIFGAYAALCAVFAAAAAHNMSGERLWHKVALPWARVAWLTLTAGIGLGAVWAYYVIGWGGYWSWDPVETASLIPWFFITAFLHTQQSHIRKGEYKVVSPMLGMLSMVGVVFVSFVVRAGGLWSESVHDYGSSSAASAATRLVAILRDDSSVSGTLIFLLHVLAITAVLTVRASRKSGPPNHVPTPKRMSGYITDGNNMVLAVTLMVLSALVATGLMVKTIDSGQAEMAAELNQKMSVLFVGIMVVMSMCLVWRTVGRDRALVLTLALAASSVALGLVAVLSDSFDGMVAFAVPSAAFAVIVAAVRLAQALAKGSAMRRVFRAGAQIAHLGVALMLAGFFVSSNMQTYPEEGPAVAFPVGGYVSVGDYVVTLVALETSDEVSGLSAGVAQVRTAIVDVSEGGRLVADEVRLEALYGHDPVSGYYLLERVAHVQSSLSEDLYLSFEWMSDSVAVLHAKVVPMMLPLWTGFVLMLVGMALRFYSFEAPSPAGRADA